MPSVEELVCRPGDLHTTVIVAHNLFTNPREDRMEPCNTGRFG